MLLLVKLRKLCENHYWIMLALVALIFSHFLRFLSLKFRKNDPNDLKSLAQLALYEFLSIFKKNYYSTFFALALLL